MKQRTLVPRSASAHDLMAATLRPICRRRFWDATGLGASTDNDPAMQNLTVPNAEPMARTTFGNGRLPRRNLVENDRRTRRVRMLAVGDAGDALVIRACAASGYARCAGGICATFASVA